MRERKERGGDAVLGGGGMGCTEELGGGLWKER